MPNFIDEGKFGELRNDSMNLGGKVWHVWCKGGIFVRNEVEMAGVEAFPVHLFRVLKVCYGLQRLPEPHTTLMHW